MKKVVLYIVNQVEIQIRSISALNPLEVSQVFSMKKKEFQDFDKRFDQTTCGQNGHTWLIFVYHNLIAHGMHNLCLESLIHNHHDKCLPYLTTLEPI